MVCQKMMPMRLLHRFMQAPLRVGKRRIRKQAHFLLSFVVTIFPRGVGVLKALGLPRQPRLSLNEIFGESSFAPTPFEQKVRYLYGLAQELERTISLMSGTLQTRVHVVIPDSEEGEVRLSKASVFVNFDDRYDVEQFVPRIRKLVSDSIEGVTPDRVEVLAIPSRVDLRASAQIPIVSVLGVRLHKDDFKLYMVEIGVLIGFLSIMIFMYGRLVLQDKKLFREKGEL